MKEVLYFTINALWESKIGTRWFGFQNYLYLYTAFRSIIFERMAEQKVLCFLDKCVAYSTGNNIPRPNHLERYLYEG